jgi:hypothetical protein
MDGERCGYPTKAGHPCGWPAAECRVPWHRQRPAVPGTGPAPSPATPQPAGVEEHDLRALAWWVIAETLGNRIDPPKASVVNAIMRTLSSLGPEPAGEERALEDVVLRGLLMHGIPPRDEEEWVRAAELFDDEALAEFRRWAVLLGEADSDDRLEPLFPGE